MIDYGILALDQHTADVLMEAQEWVSDGACTVALVFEAMAQVTDEHPEYTEAMEALRHRARKLAARVLADSV